jgi:hypothetical protein
MEQLFIYKYIYATMSKPLCPMHHIDLEYLQTRDYFSDAMAVIEKIGLTNLLTIQCDCNEQLVIPLFATLVMKTDDPKTIKWMTRPTPC